MTCATMKRLEAAGRIVSSEQWIGRHAGHDVEDFVDIGHGYRLEGKRCNTCKEKHITKAGPNPEER